MFEEYPDILSAGEALEALRVGENSLYQLLNSGKLKAYKNGRNWLIPKEAMRQFVIEQAKMMYPAGFLSSNPCVFYTAACSYSTTPF